MDEQKSEFAMEDLELGFAPGEATATEGQQEDWGSQRQFIPKQYQERFRELCAKIALRDQFARIEKVKRCAIRRFAWRNMLDVYWDGGRESWADFTMTPNGPTYSPADADSGNIQLHYPVNIFQAFGRNFMTTVSEPWKLRMEARKVSSPDALRISSAADAMRQHVESVNDLEELRQEASRLAWTDEGVHFYTRWVTDGARFGYDDEEPEEDQSEGVGGGGDPPPKQPRPAKGGELISAFGDLEVKTPINLRHQADFPWRQLCYEIDIATARANYPWIAKQIQAGETGPGEYTFDRTTRIAVTQGIQVLQQTGDSVESLPTLQQTWMRPSYFAEIEDDEERQWFTSNYPDGALVTYVGNSYACSRNESMDDHWNTIKPLTGDGQSNPACGQIIMPVQDMISDMMDLLMTTNMKVIPAIWVNKKIADQQALSQQEATPGMHISSKEDLEPGEKMADGFWPEPAAELGATQLSFVQELFGNIPQFLTGQYPAAMGGSDPDNQTVRGIQILRDQSKAQTGLAWQALRKGFAKSMTQAVRIGAYMRLAESQEGMLSLTVEGEDVTVDLEDLREGNWACFPDGDETYPNTHSERQMALKEFFTMAAGSPQGMAVISEPKNQLLYKELNGLDELEIPGADSEEKQLGEIQLLLQQAPIPNMQTAMMFKAMQIKAALTGQPPPPMPPVEARYDPSVPIDEDYDDSAAEWSATKDWINSSEGQQAKINNPPGFMNVRLHGLKHKAVNDKAQQNAMMTQLGMQAKAEQAKAAAKASATPKKSPSESINFADLGPAGKIQVGAQAGLDLRADAAADMAHDQMGEPPEAK